MTATTDVTETAPAPHHNPPQPIAFLGLRPPILIPRVITNHPLGRSVLGGGGARAGRVDSASRYWISIEARAGETTRPSMAASSRKNVRGMRLARRVASR
ncbi:hypothetical protein [Haladaptatus sp. W1]|uniref:hypothetical protein n=1 Tax=Haladaptatus sp. W1 TaxID=1897478 RepID=UPI0015866F89|nr:hypothetical protein [Haladaptatus sp. W1]